MSRIQVDHADGVTEIVLADPERGNALDIEFVEELDEAFRGVVETGAILLRAEGPNFCVGGDVRTFAGPDPGRRIRDLAERLHDMLRTFARLQAPTVVAVQGWAAGAGFSLALTADLMLVGDGARFKTAYNQLGLTSDGGMTWHLPRRLPRAIALDLLFTDRVLDVDQAIGYGLAVRRYLDNELADGALAFARSLAAGSTPSLAAMRQLVDAGAVVSLSDHLDAEADAIVAAADRYDGREGIAAFLERRPPRFSDGL